MPKGTGWLGGGPAAPWIAALLAGPMILVIGALELIWSAHESAVWSDRPDATDRQATRRAALRDHQRLLDAIRDGNAERAERIGRNAKTFGVPGLHVVTGSAPSALEGLPQPDAIFIGGGGSEAGVMDAATAAEEQKFIKVLGGE